MLKTRTIYPVYCGQRKTMKQILHYNMESAFWVSFGFLFSTFLHMFLYMYADRL